MTTWTVDCQSPLSMGSSRQEYQSGSSFPSPGELYDPGIETQSLVLQADSLQSEPPESSQLFLLAQGRSTFSSFQRHGDQLSHTHSKIMTSQRSLFKPSSHMNGKLGIFGIFWLLDLLCQRLCSILTGSHLHHILISFSLYYICLPNTESSHKL